LARGDQAAAVQISEGTIKDGNISFKVVREGRQGNQITTTYKGKLDGDVIKGTTELQFGDQPVTRDWEAKREKAAS
jgi:hypothetical protein